ncbi:MAG: permease-like cell division protein FtsX [Actinomycetota bacterium]|jgi:cell division transport system permease protein
MAPRFGHAFQEAVNGLRRNLVLSVSVVLVVAISLTLLGVGMLTRQQVNLFTGYWTGKVEVSVFLTTDVSEEQRTAIGDQLRAMPEVNNVYYESKDEAFGRFKEQFRDSPDMIANVDPQSLPESYRVKLHDPSKFAVVRDRLCQTGTDGKQVCTPGIDQVVDQRKVLDKLFKVLDILRLAISVLAAVLLLAAGTLIAVTIRVAAFARRKETAIMKLVGATNWYIRLPFMLEGQVAGVVGALVAGVLLAAGKWLLIDPLRRGVSLFQFTPFVGSVDFFNTWLVLLAAGVVISGLSSILALRRFLDV